MAGLNFTLKTAANPTPPPSTNVASLGLKTAALPQGAGWNSDRRDDSVENGVTRLMSDDSKLMRQAQTAGLQQANKRGLLNSSMAVGAAQNEGYKAALPIASQDASQAFQENLTNRDIAARFGMQENDIKSQVAQQNADIASRFGMQAAEIKAQFGMQENDLLSRQQLADLDASNRLQLANIDVDARKDMQAAEIAYNTGKDQLGKYLAELGNDTEQQRIMASYITSQEQIYSARLSDIMNNKDLTAAQRTEQVEAAKQSFTGHLDAISNILSVDVTEFMLWPGSTSAPAASAPAASTPAPPTPAPVAPAPAAAPAAPTYPRVHDTAYGAGEYNTTSPYLRVYSDNGGGSLVENPNYRGY